MDRFGGIDPDAIAEADPEEFAALCVDAAGRAPLPGSMTPRLQGLARIVVDEYDGRPRALEEAARGRPGEATAALPGFGKQKAQIFTALVAKQLDVLPRAGRGRSATTVGVYRSVADVVDEASLTRVREFKKEKKAAAKARAD